MLDSRDALDVGALPPGVEFAGYVDSWRTDVAGKTRK
jgi:hypothetical protein